MTRGDQTSGGHSSSSRRVTPLPGGWKRIRQDVLTRDGWQCTVIEQGVRCSATTKLEVDHLGDPEDHSLANLATKCNWHHARKTGRDANAVRWSRPAEPTRRHPGLVG